MMGKEVVMTERRVIMMTDRKLVMEKVLMMEKNVMMEEMTIMKTLFIIVISSIITFAKTQINQNWPLSNVLSVITRTMLAQQSVYDMEISLHMTGCILTRRYKKIL